MTEGPPWLGMMALFDDDVADALRRRVIPFRAVAEPVVERWLFRTGDAERAPAAAGQTNDCM